MNLSVLYKFCKYPDRMPVYMFHHSKGYPKSHIRVVLKSLICPDENEPYSSFVLWKDDGKTR